VSWIRYEIAGGGGRRDGRIRLPRRRPARLAPFAKNLNNALPQTVVWQGFHSNSRMALLSPFLATRELTYTTVDRATPAHRGSVSRQ
jgi:hypothetical protein